MTKEVLINQLIQERSYTNYLEIGYGAGNCFKEIDIKSKQAVDPNASGEGVFTGTSDDFFEQTPAKKKYSIILIDGLHHADQVEGDVINAYNRLKKGGCIIMHDINPATEEMTRIPRMQRQWCGDVYKVWHGLNIEYASILESYPFDHGIGIINHSPHVHLQPGLISDITFKEYKTLYFG